MRALVFGWLALTFLNLNAHAAEMPKNWLFLGADIGYLNLNTSHPLEVGKSGIEAGVKLVGSHYFDAPWVVDLGGGWLYSYISGEGLGTVKNIKVITRSFYAELSPRYRFDEHWQAGPILQFLTGGDVSYDEDGNVNELKSQWRIGARAQYEFGDDWRWRFGIQGFTDLNIDSRRIIGVVADIQFGFAPGGRSPASDDTRAAAAGDTASHVAKPAFVEVKGKSIRLYMDEDLLRFGTAKYELDSKSQSALKKILPVLVQNQNAWKKMRIEGHTDIRNYSGQNQKLSEERAKVVESILRDSKLPESKLSTVGLAATKPIDPARNARAYSLNRRVEIWLDDVKPDQIEQITAALKKTQ